MGAPGLKHPQKIAGTQHPPATLVPEPQGLASGATSSWQDAFGGGGEEQAHGGVGHSEDGAPTAGKSAPVLLVIYSESVICFIVFTYF